MKKLPAAIGTIVVVFAATGLLFLSGALNFPEYKTYDFRVRLLAELSRPSDDIMVILLDQDSLDWAQKERNWGWPWPRKAYAELVDYMRLGGAKSIAFDMLFTEPSVYRNAQQEEIIEGAVKNLQAAEALMGETQVPQTGRERSIRNQPEQRQSFREAGLLFRRAIEALRELSSREDDASFVRAAGDFGRVVQGVFLSTQTGSESSWPQNLTAPLLEPQGDILPSRLGSGETGSFPNAQFPIEELRNTAGAIGTLTGLPDKEDDVLRRIQLYHLFDNKVIPGLAPASLLVSGYTRDFSFDAKSRTIRWGNYSLPTDRDGNLILRFRGNLDRYVPYFAWQILESAGDHKEGRSPLLPPEDFNGKYVFFGVYAPGLYDIFTTPFSSVYPGVGMHITMLDNILTGDFIRESPVWIGLVIIFAAVALVTFLTMYCGHIPLSVGGMVLSLLLVIGLGFGAYHFGSLWLPMVAPVIAVLVSFLAAVVYNYATEGSQKRFIKSAFSRYLSPKVIDRIIADPSQLKLGGEKREMTAIFTDVRSFSTISEALGDPAKLVELLNYYLTRMSNIVLENSGTIDKYEGDAIIAFFGAPVYMENNASLACRSAVRMHKAEKEINREVVAQGLITGNVMDALVRKGILKTVQDPPLFTRFGVNTGDMVVVNMGTPNKMDYTIMGDAVNLAARLEGINKQYNTGGILISEFTRAKIGDEFIMRPLSRVRVVGKNIPIRLYELLDIREEAPAGLAELTGIWEKALKAYENRRFSEALRVFKAVYQKYPQDRVAKLYQDRCEKYCADPPPEDKWENGVDNLTEK
ncbi:MAG: adenylate/guanylate cyclase domain-containing protein [Treponema sp.]|jgi:class 3 adenylate cyclase/CHASE2 domain-containing sensor protein|nr:adenylate/guanylate cyclase domain-containing protein [Treponema sp.]